MISKCAFPLVRAMLAEVYNGTIFCTRTDHVPLVADDVNFDYVGTTFHYPCTEQDLVAAEVILGQQPDMVKGFAQVEDDSTAPAPLVLAANAFCESVGLV